MDSNDYTNPPSSNLDVKFCFPSFNPLDSRVDVEVPTIAIGYPSDAVYSSVRISAVAGDTSYFVKRHFRLLLGAEGLPEGIILPKKDKPLRRLMDRGDTVLGFEI